MRHSFPIELRGIATHVSCDGEETLLLCHDRPFLFDGDEPRKAPETSAEATHSLRWVVREEVCGPSRILAFPR